MLKRTFSSIFSVTMILFIICLTSTEAEAAFLPIDTLKAIAIYASGPEVVDTLPSWYSTIFNPSEQRSLPAYLDQISFHQYGLDVFATGRDDQHCFVASVSPESRIADFTFDVLTAADSVIDFSQFDITGPQNMPDGYVDMVFLMITPYGDGHGQAEIFLLLNRRYFETNDTSVTGEPIKIGKYEGTSNYVGFSRKGALACVIHEFGHILALDDLDHDIFTEFNHYGLGAFDPMAYWYGFQKRPSPYNPWSRIGRLGWITPTNVTGSMYDRPIQDINEGHLV